MSKTYRRDDIKGTSVRDGAWNSHRYSKESRYIRVKSARKVRRGTKRALYNEDYDNLPIPRKTSGWDTW